MSTDLILNDFLSSCESSLIVILICSKLSELQVIDEAASCMSMVKDQMLLLHMLDGLHDHFDYIEKRPTNLEEETGQQVGTK